MNKKIKLFITTKKVFNCMIALTGESFKFEFEAKFKFQK